ncbi:MAG: GNAT family N-acetyltransferase [Proteobacteria bacterium]|nr:GNAT family N-acetyltransferase [Cystobacterineae bacterium]MCL2259419.1 GNAT family N-acetyltransferase [Cystobacterineae bacterium]MCL2314134.1 GNAT family N-acetyltransferase [Pseudomonadota bacterium]
MNSELSIHIEPARSDGELMQVLAIQEVVFIEEQGMSLELGGEVLEREALHVLAYEKGHAVGTGRLIILEEPPPGEEGRWGQLAGMAVLRSSRRVGIGKALLEALLGEAKQFGLDGLSLHAQVSAQSFYEKEGFVVCSEVFHEAGMAHVEMRRVF